jgi:hypothetical protein
VQEVGDHLELIIAVTGEELNRASSGKFGFNLVATNGQVIATSFATVMQAALIPVAYSVGTDFKAAVGASLDTMVH